MALSKEDILAFFSRKYENKILTMSEFKLFLMIKSFFIYFLQKLNSPEDYGVGQGIRNIKSAINNHYSFFVILRAQMKMFSYCKSEIYMKSKLLNDKKSLI